jgi:hypothetical protein
MKICIWSTSLQADTLALALALNADPEIELLVVAANLAAYRSEPIAIHCPLDCALIDRSEVGHEARVMAFNADIFIADNHLPKYLVGERLVFLWHGLPLKIQPNRDIRSFHRRCKRLVGSVKRVNKRFLAQCYQKMDFDHRVNHWKIAPSNCRSWGSGYTDLLLAPPYQRHDLEDYYRLDVTGRKNILISLTWNFGDKAFGVLGDDDAIFTEIFRIAEAHDANIIFSMHDRFRFNDGFVQKIEYYAARYPRSFVKFKNEHADNLADLVVSDVMICNFSSFIVFHYFTGKPSIHIQPVDDSKWFIGLPTLKGGRIRGNLRLNTRRLWLYPFQDNGGLLPLTQQQLADDLSRSLEDPTFGQQQAQQFIADKIHNPDGATCNRIIRDLKDWIT